MLYVGTVKGTYQTTKRAIDSDMFSWPQTKPRVSPKKPMSERGMRPFDIENIGILHETGKCKAKSAVCRYVALEYQQIPAFFPHKDSHVGTATFSVSTSTNIPPFVSARAVGKLPAKYDNSWIYI